MTSPTWSGSRSGAYRADATEFALAGMIIAVADIAVTDPRSRDIGTFLDFVASLVRADVLVVLADDIRLYGDARYLDDYRLRAWALVESVGDCSAISLRDLGVKRLSNGSIQAPMLVGRVQSIRYLCSCAQPLPAYTAIFESRRTQIDYRPFRRLWKRPIPIKEEVPPEQRMDRRIWVTGIASRLAEMHQDGILHGDAHQDNFAYREGGLEVLAGDFADMRWLYRPPSIAQCAASLVPLMQSIAYPEEWDWVRDGYIAKRGKDGLRVFDFIQYRDLTGWVMEIRSESQERAVALLHEQLDGEGESEDETNALVFSALGQCLGVIRRYEEAKEAYRRAFKLGASDREALPLMLFGLALTHLRTGHPRQAARAFEQVLECEAEQPTDPYLSEQAERILRNIRKRE